MSFDFTRMDWPLYLLDTAHLSLTEHGAYLVMLAHIYAAGDGLPDDDDYLFMLCRCRSKADKKAVLKMKTMFLYGKNGKLYNKRADVELKHRKQRSESAKTSARARWKNS